MLFLRLKYKLGPKEFEGTPLTLAVKLDKPGLVRKLIDFKADPESQYSMSAGRLRVHWTGPAICATVAKGNLSMMRPGQGECSDSCLVEKGYQSHIQRDVLSLGIKPYLPL